jgi:SAM-dependent methyltransferase
MNRKDWENVANKGSHYFSGSFLCRCKKRQIAAIIRKWDKASRRKWVLKTDLFEEALGYDGITRWLAGRYKNIVGMDISFGIISRASSADKNDSSIRYALNDIRNASFKENSFDLIISNSTIDHFPEIDSALQELYRILKPGGALILTLHNRLQLFFSLQIWVKRILKIKDYSFGYSFTFNSISPRILSAGFHITDKTYIYFFPPVISFCESHFKGKLGSMFRKIIRVYESKLTNNKYLNKFAGSNIALRLIK